jgi:hypothetical protein
MAEYIKKRNFMKTYRVTFTLKRPLKWRQHVDEYDTRQTDVEAKSEIEAIMMAQFQLKRLINFDHTFIDTMSSKWGLHFLHGLEWDINTKIIK